MRNVCSPEEFLTSLSSIFFIVGAGSKMDFPNDYLKDRNIFKKKKKIKREFRFIQILGSQKKIKNIWSPTIKRRDGAPAVASELIKAWIKLRDKA